MQLVISHWFSVSSQAQTPHVLFKVDSQTPKHERKRIRAVLQSQDCDPRRPDSITVGTNIFESSITLHINGLIDTGMAIGVDRNGHLTLYLCTQAQTIQRRGRAGRVYDSLYMTLRPNHVHPPPFQDYEMPKQEALPLILAAISLKKSFPIIGISQTAQIQYQEHLEALSIVRKISDGTYVLTSLGEEVLHTPHDLRASIVSAVCGRFNLPWHGRLAAA